MMISNWIKPFGLHCRPYKQIFSTLSGNDHISLASSFLNVKLLTLSGLKWNESGFRPPLCTYRLNWAWRTSWGWWDDRDDTVLQTQDSKFEPWRSEAEHATSRSRRLPTILTFTRGWGRNILCFFQTAETGNRTPNSGVKGSGANHYPRAPALVVHEDDFIRFKNYRNLPCFGKPVSWKFSF